MPPISKKIFVSYKYSDSSVAALQHAINNNENTTARHYVDVIQSLLENGDHIYKGENDDESLEGFKDSTIESKLRNKIFDSTISIVLISKNMRDIYKNERDQWIPWEVSYSLKEISRNGRTSSSNGILAVVLPDETGSYSYFIDQYPCVTSFKTNLLFDIMAQNMFNRNNKNIIRCNTCSGTHHTGDDHSYIHPVKWVDFVSNVNGYINHAATLKENIDHFTIVKELA